MKEVRDPLKCRWKNVLRGHFEEEEEVDERE
jgi:hypothetical protein